MDIEETSVSGISSGAYFATQMQVAFSSIMKGAGIIAGGPYDCGGETQFIYCMYYATPLVSLSVQKTKLWSGSKIDDISNMKKHKVYLFSGTMDSTVSYSVVNQLYSYYVTIGGFVDEDNVVFDHDHRTEHTFPTDFDAEGNSQCEYSTSPFISNCHFDTAGKILQHIYGELNARVNKSSGNLIRFSQKEFIENPRSYGLDDYGYVYVPKSCAEQAKCRLHVAFHGCKQSEHFVGLKFVKDTGYDLWADKNNLIILFPQTYPGMDLHLTPFNGYQANFNGCWDWIGYYDNNFPTRQGVQMSTIKKMIDKICAK